MNILVINCGSSSLKFQVIDTDNGSVLAKGLCERIGIDGAITYQNVRDHGGKIKTKTQIEDHKKAISLVLDAITDPQGGVVKTLAEIGAVGHRIVHGGEKFTESTLIDDDVIQGIREVSDLAPLHNPANLTGILACRALMPNTPMVAVFDTSFHQTMPPKAYLYALPQKYYEKYRIRRYGFHGTSHKYVSRAVASFLGKKPEDLKTIVCHLGNGASVSAVEYGKCIDTSMGLTPLEGLIMGTRSGDVDPAVVSYIADKENITASEVIDILNKESGVEALSGGLSDFRDLWDARDRGDEKATLALDAWAYRVAKYIGAYVAAMNGVDVIAFTAGIGENDDKSRALIYQYLGYLGITIDDAKNAATHGDAAIISTPESKVTVVVYPTNEELAIAQDTLALVEGARKN
ncbi:MAG: acetate kinase [Lachnospiraceae bacterium]|jgi:acetate kinase